MALECDVRLAGHSAALLDALVTFLGAREPVVEREQAALRE
jgi:hypothetical protein